MAKVAINGLGRIGRATLRIVMNTPGLDLVAANDLGGADNIVYLLKYDTVYGRYEKTVEAAGGHLTIGEHRLTLLRESDPARLPWKALDVDIVFECTGAFTRREDLDAHIRAGARYVILSSPSKSDDVETIVHGVNTPQGGTVIISCASCTTNCITPVMEILGRRIDVLGQGNDAAVRQGLLELRGVGRWTAEYVLLRGLGRFHVFPGDDVGAQKRLARWLGRSRPMDYAGVQRAVRRWSPYAGLVYFHLLLDGLSQAGALDSTRSAR